MSGDHCSCGLKFRTGEDFRDHMPCPGTKEEQVSADLRARLKLAVDLLEQINRPGFCADLHCNVTGCKGRDNRLKREALVTAERKLGT